MSNMSNRYYNYRDCHWEIPLKNGEVDQIQLTLDLFGRETLRLNGTLISKRIVLKTRNRYEIPLSDGRQAVIVIKANMSTAGKPACELSVDGSLVTPNS